MRNLSSRSAKRTSARRTKCGSRPTKLRAIAMAINPSASVKASAAVDRSPPISPIVLIRGAGEMASAVAWRLRMANIRRICMMELDAPLCVRRTVSFCTAIESGRAQVEGIEACVANNLADVERAWREGKIAVIAGSRWHEIASLVPDIVIDAILRQTQSRDDHRQCVIGDRAWPGLYCRARLSSRC